MRLRALVPARVGWWRLLAAPSSYALVVAIVITAVVKIGAASALDGGGIASGIVAGAADLAFYAGAAALLALAEHAARWAFYVTIPLALALLVGAAINAIYLAISGEQLSWPVVAVGVDRFGDVVGIASELPLVPPIAGAVVVIASYAAMLVLVRRRGRSICPRADALARAHAAAVLAAVGLAAMLLPAPDDYALARLRGNATLRTYAGLVTGATTSAGDYTFRGFAPLVDAAAVQTLRSGARPNVVLIILESTGREAIAGAPSYTALAARGAEVTHARAVLPHTTKSVWSILCGQPPFMQPQLHEIAATTDAQCLAAVLAAAGWRTGWFQSASGTFEDRPRLAHRFGFQHFAAREDIGGPSLGYLGGDDARLVAPFAAWIDGGQPFFATLLTSAAHHPYEYPGVTGSDRERYAQIVARSDAMIGEVLTALRARGLLDTTIIVVVGDHGEGFGDKGVRQHDNNFFEEGLRVPWVMAGPGVPQRRITADASLADVAPTVLDLLGVRAVTGHSVLRDTPPRSLPFACFYDTRCRGFVRSGNKVVYVPELDHAFWFDLATDPDERAPKPLTGELHRELRAVHAAIDAYRKDGAIVRGEVTYPTWTCPANGTCAHR